MCLVVRDALDELPQSADTGSQQQRHWSRFRAPAAVMTAGATKSVARATNLGCLRSAPDKLKLLLGLLSAVHAAVMTVEVCGHRQQQQRSQKYTAAG